jgi:hypothetical protein
MTTYFSLGLHAIFGTAIVVAIGQAPGRDGLFFVSGAICALDRSLCGDTHLDD